MLQVGHLVNVQMKKRGVYAAAAGAVKVFCLLASPAFLALSLLVVVIAWARWKLEAHSPLPAIGGAALAVAVTVTAYWFFGIR